MKKVENKIKKAWEIARQVEEALTTGDWEQVSPDSPRLREEVGSPGQLYNNIKRHDSFDTEKALAKFISATRPVRRIPVFYKYAVAIACLLVLGVGFYLFQSDATRDNDTRSLAQNAYLILDNGQKIDLSQPTRIDHNGLRIINSSSRKVSYQQGHDTPSSSLNKLVVPEGAEYTLQLSDGTNVHLNAGSTLIFPSVFKEDTRIVELSGEAYFDVTHSGTPFIVKSPAMSVKVLGTTFNMMVYPDAPLSTTTLLTGKVEVICNSTGDTVTRTTVLTPGLQARFERRNGVLEVDSVDVEEQTAWRRGEFAFENMDLGSIMATIGRSFALNVVFEDPELQEIKCYISVKKEKGIEEILKILNMATGVQFKIKEDTIRVCK